MGDGTVEMLRIALGFGVMPLWLAAGAADAALHRRQSIECTAGVRESALHLAMLVELGAAVTMALWLEPTAALFVVLLALALAHEFTLLADLRHAQATRIIPVAEQWVHALQQMLPWVALAGLALLWPAQALALAGLGDVPADGALRLRAEPLPGAYVAAVLAGGLLLNAGPFLLELRRALALQRAAVLRRARPSQ